MAKTRVAVLMGSNSDWPMIEPCVTQLRAFGIDPHVEVMSAHRSPRRVQTFASSARDSGFQVIIAAAGMSAALAGSVAAETTLPVIGIPLPGGTLDGLDALLSTVQMPPGVPVATMGIGRPGAKNAAVLAVRILSVADADLRGKLEKYRTALEAGVARRNRALHEGHLAPGPSAGADTTENPAG